ncbi:aldehyde dehydrogenase (NADP(+)) [Pokkaliibacter sp. CJK22405]|uniref:aldehyde dehydrogenase (NADP(+)) n=1 Tax=Pokkaliibacter sp. CJK22405 TaxID=3384615 RepID=UPI0039850535
MTAITMSFSTGHLIAGQWQTAEGLTFQAMNPSNQTPLAGEFLNADTPQVSSALSAANEAFQHYRQCSRQKRAQLLETIAAGLEAHKGAIIARAHLETALPIPRLEGELSRTSNQFRLFADLLKSGEWPASVQDDADADRKPPRPSLMRVMIPLGPVVVFGASNFPLAFSTPGGDTASALAAGCPVIVKGHPAHPGTSALCAEVIRQALADNQLPGACFSLLQGQNPGLSALLVEHPLTRAVGFTGSQKVGRLLFDLAVKRRDPIPFYGELGSSNPVVLLPGAINNRGEHIATELCASIGLGAGQFCTNPGLVLGIDSPQWQAFLLQVGKAAKEQKAQTMLTAAMAEHYTEALKDRQSLNNVKLLAKGLYPSAGQAQMQLLHTSASELLDEPALEEEIFGPTSLFVSCEDEDELLQVIQQLDGHLTATIHMEDSDAPLASHLLPTLAHQVGRLLFNGYPTGVEVCQSMQHGGPYPASTDVRSTSVGSAAIERFVRPLCLQNYPSSLEPELITA